jgi:hypothetical protein
LKCPFYAWPGSTCSTSAHRIDYQQGRLFRLSSTCSGVLNSVKPTLVKSFRMGATNCSGYIVYFKFIVYAINKL